MCAATALQQQLEVIIPSIQIHRGGGFTARRRTTPDSGVQSLRNQQCSSRRRCPGCLSLSGRDAPLNESHARPTILRNKPQQQRSKRTWSQGERVHQADDEGYMIHSRRGWKFCVKTLNQVPASPRCLVQDVFVPRTRPKGTNVPSACCLGTVESNVKKCSSGGTSMPKARVKARKDLPTHEALQRARSHVRMTCC